MSPHSLPQLQFELGLHPHYCLPTLPPAKHFPGPLLLLEFQCLSPASLHHALSAIYVILSAPTKDFTALFSYKIREGSGNSLYFCSVPKKIILQLSIPLLYPPCHSVCILFFPFHSPFCPQDSTLRELMKEDPRVQQL